VKINRLPVGFNHSGPENAAYLWGIRFVQGFEATEWGMECG